MQPPPAMTNTGVGGVFETQMLTRLNSEVGGWAARFRTLRSQPGQPGFPISQATDLASAAQEETEHYFEPFIHGATRVAGEEYHPGSYQLSTMLHDQSTRTIAPAWRLQWVRYWMSHQGRSILEAHNYLQGRAADDAEFARVATLFTDGDAARGLPDHHTDIEDAIHGWPAEATGGIHIQPYVNVSNTSAVRRTRWDLFTTLIHEFMHVLAHANFKAAYNLLGGTAKEILKEGFADLMRHELWDGPGRLQSRLGDDAMAPLRRRVEGGEYDYDASVVHYHRDYDELQDAYRIVEALGGPGRDRTVGHHNAKAAYFLGHVELLGLGEGTGSSAPGGRGLPGIGMYAATDAAEAEIVVAVAGDTYDTLRARTNARPGGILDAATGAPLTATSAISPGARLRVPGVRWVYVIANDTPEFVAHQNGISLAVLQRANPAMGSTVTAGQRLLIPVH
ncbi:hypothetical protein BE08_37845 [Sorangium cellulosum]|uniref:LysM domain-containing protein n=1 Tax=Sorangium cellulosum TaxID=56 RepID=A0A150PRD8_SORCE|nr:hypothetical protein BE08_37845 [Sorangium cellulosum]